MTKPKKEKLVQRQTYEMPKILKDKMSGVDERSDNPNITQVRESRQAPKLMKKADISYNKVQKNKSKTAEERQKDYTYTQIKKAEYESSKDPAKKAADLISNVRMAMSFAPYIGPVFGASTYGAQNLYNLGKGIVTNNDNLVQLSTAMLPLNVVTSGKAEAAVSAMKNLNLGTAKFTTTKPEFKANIDRLNEQLNFARQNREAANMSEQELIAINRYLSGIRTPESLKAYKDALVKLKTVNPNTEVAPTVQRTKTLNDLNDEEFEQYVLKTKPEEDHYPTFLDGRGSPEEFISTVGDEFRSASVGTRFDTGKILSGASLSPILAKTYRWVRDGKARVYFHPNEGWTLTNGAAIDKDPTEIVNSLQRGFTRLGLPEEEAGFIRAIPNSDNTIQYSIPLMSIIKTRKFGGKLIKKNRYDC